ISVFDATDRQIFFRTPDATWTRSATGAWVENAPTKLDVQLVANQNYAVFVKTDTGKNKLDVTAGTFWAAGRKLFWFSEFNQPNLPGWRYNLQTDYRVSWETGGVKFKNLAAEPYGKISSLIVNPTDRQFGYFKSGGAGATGLVDFEELKCDNYYPAATDLWAVGQGSTTSTFRVWVETASGDWFQGEVAAPGDDNSIYLAPAAEAPAGFTLISLEKGSAVRQFRLADVPAVLANSLTVAVFNENNKLVWLRTPDASTAFTYNAAGNLTGNTSATTFTLPSNSVWTIYAQAGNQGAAVRLPSALYGASCGKFSLVLNSEWSGCMPNIAALLGADAFAVNIAQSGTSYVVKPNFNSLAAGNVRFFYIGRKNSTGLENGQFDLWNAQKKFKASLNRSSAAATQYACGVSLPANSATAATVSASDFPLHFLVQTTDGVTYSKTLAQPQTGNVSLPASAPSPTLAAALDKMAVSFYEKSTQKLRVDYLTPVPKFRGSVTIYPSYDNPLDRQIGVRDANGNLAVRYKLGNQWMLGTLVNGNHTNYEGLYFLSASQNKPKWVALSEGSPLPANAIKIMDNSCICRSSNSPTFGEYIAGRACNIGGVDQFDFEVLTGTLNSKAYWLPNTPTGEYESLTAGFSYQVYRTNDYTEVAGQPREYVHQENLPIAAGQKVYVDIGSGANNLQLWQLERLDASQTWLNSACPVDVMVDFNDPMPSVAGDGPSTMPTPVPLTVEKYGMRKQAEGYANRNFSNTKGEFQVRQDADFNQIEMLLMVESPANNYTGKT
ncbi:MAG: hypothetical protein AAB316_15925, partial [Bacteroidota bacterium]